MADVDVAPRFGEELKVSLSSHSLVHEKELNTDISPPVRTASNQSMHG